MKEYKLRDTDLEALSRFLVDNIDYDILLTAKVEPTVNNFKETITHFLKRNEKGVLLASAG